jgi:hypothetical protein
LCFLRFDKSFSFLRLLALAGFYAMICIHSSRFPLMTAKKREEAENAEMQAASQMSSMASIRLQ